MSKESPRRFSAAVLTVSDTASQDTNKDASGPLVGQLLEEGGFRVQGRAVLPDEPDQVRDWVAQQAVNVVICTGGTGFGVRDSTPEAVTPLIARHAPGLVHLMIATSLKVTPLAALARPVAGLTAEGKLIITLPGSPKGARENLQAILPVLSHALDLANGGTGKATHQKLAATDAQSHSHSHHHHHHLAPKARTMVSSDMSGGASSRLRVSPYPLIDLQAAYDLILHHTPVLEIENRRVDSPLRGHVLAEDVAATSDWPPTHTTNVDGYAVRSTDSPGVYKVTTPAQLAGAALPAGSICRINTGGPLPTGADSVVMVEDTLLVRKDDRGEELEVDVRAQVDQGENVRKPGSDVRAGIQVLAKGDLVSEVGGEIGTLAFIGRTQVKVHCKPRVALLSTGNEIRDLYDASSSASTPDSNRPSLHLALAALGYEVLDLGIAVDTVEATKAALERGRDQADIIIATGGTSMGEADMLKPVIERELNGTIHFGRVAMKPVFALPGNPASALVTFNLFVIPALRRLEGRQPMECHLPRLKAITQDDLALDPRPEFHRVRLVIHAGKLHASSTGGQRSSRTVSLAHANGLVALPSGQGRVAKGSEVEVVLIGAL